MMIRHCSANVINKFTEIQNKRTAQARQIIPLDEVNREVICSVMPNYMYVEVSGLHGDQFCPKLSQLYGTPILRGNDNGDGFRWQETLLKYEPKYGMYAFDTWRGKDNLLNHNETKVVGDIPDVWPVLKDKSINMLIRTCTKRAWDVCESVRKGIVDGTSMGTIVNHSFCTVCGNRAETEDAWCDCLKQHKGSLMHPDMLKTASLRDKWKHGVWACEDNRGVFGIEISWITVGEPADSGALVKNILVGMKGPEGRQFNNAKKANYSKIADAFYEKISNKKI